MRKISFSNLGLKTLFIGTSLFLLIGGIYATKLVKGELRAESSASRFQVYDKVSIVSDEYTVVDVSDNEIKLLCDSNWCTTGNSYTYADTESYINGYGNEKNTHGREGSSVLNNKFAIPSESDLSNIKTGDTLDSRIATSNSGFWLSDDGGTNRKKYIDQNNSFLGENTIYNAPDINIIKNQKVCTNSTSKEVGVLLVEDDPNESSAKEIIISSKGLTGYSTYVNNNGEWSGVKAYHNNFCYAGVNNEFQSATAPQNTNINHQQTVDWDIVSGFKIDKGIANDSIQMSMLMSVIDMDDFFNLHQGQTNIMVFDVSFNQGCLDISKTNHALYKSVMIPKQGNKIKYRISSAAKNSKSETKCSKLNPAGKTGRRPILTLKEEDILEINQAKRSYAPTGGINSIPPTSDTAPISDRSVITLRNNTLDVNLKSGAPGVDGSIYTVLRPSDDIVTLPLTFSGDRDGEGNVISATAIIDGVEKYGILDTIGLSSSKDIKLDLKDFSDDPSSLTEIKLNLFQESAGNHKSSYRGVEKEITIKLETPKVQAIAFDEHMPTDVTYGDQITLSAKLTSALSDQANTNLLFSVKSGNASITAQSYDGLHQGNTGKASAILVPLNGEGKVIVEINKAGDASIESAPPQTLELTLHKKALKISPTRMNKLFQLNDAMPSITSDFEGLIRGDEQLVSSIRPVLSPLEGTSASRPDSGGKVVNTGIWKLVYMNGILNGLTDLNARYDVTLRDYHDDASYVFETAISDLPDGWIILEPNPNAKGWNLQAVQMKPSDTAIHAGYTRIEVMNGADVTAFGESITYSNDTTGITPLVRLCKGSVCTNAKDAPREIKIDQTPPAILISVDNENGWSPDEKTVTVSAIDATSDIDTVELIWNHTTSFQPIKNGNDYVFKVNRNGSYQVNVSDQAGNLETVDKTITGIDDSTPTITAVKQNHPTPPTYQNIELTWSAGNSGLKAFEVYYKKDSTAAYVQIEGNLNPTQNVMLYMAEMNGYYKFIVRNQAGKTAETEVEISGLTPPYPDTGIEAVLADDPTQPYISDTWTRHDVVISLSNINPDLNVPGVDFTWEVSEDNGNSWTSMGTETSMRITTDTLLMKTYWFKVTARKGAETFVENDPGKLTVKIDKRLPSVPTIKDAHLYQKTAWFSGAVTLESTFTSKSSGIKEVLYVCADTKAACEADESLWDVSSDGKYRVSGNGSHEVYFKAVDEAGNESALSAPAFVNINDAQPSIKITLNNDPINSFLNQLTFGYFFQDTVRVKAEVEYGDGISGKSYIVIDETGGAMPMENDAVWGSERSSTTIDPDKKAMIYVKAVSDTGISARASSVYEVVADKTKPVITVSNHTAGWTNDNTLEVSITDNLSGVDEIALTYTVDQTDVYAFGLINDAATLTNLKNGTYDVELYAADRSGNEQTETIPVNIDRIKPVIGEPLSPNGSANKKTVKFTASDALSGIDADRLQVIRKSDSSILSIQTGSADGEYTFEATSNDTYIIQVFDLAGNSATREYIETQLDTAPPSIYDIVIGNENDWTINKPVTFKVSDSDSGVGVVQVSYLEDGVTRTAALNGPDAQGTYRFTANMNGTYTITALDQAGNSTTETIEIGNIDPDGLKIVNISDIQTWTKDTMLVHFEVRTSTSTLNPSYPRVTRDGQSYPVTAERGIYEFCADVNGAYVIEAENTMGDHVRETIQIQRIDQFSPVITDVSENHTSTEWREPQIITFQVFDYNNDEKTGEGSGMKTGYPKVYYLTDGQRTEAALTQIPANRNGYQFTADQNTTYYVEAIDAVEHEPVVKEIPVDHIRKPEEYTDLIVTAEHDGRVISSGTWVKQNIVFTLQGGLSEGELEGYEVAVTDGSQPSEADWEEINDPFQHQHTVTADTKGRSIWFRSVPFIDQAQISEPFIVNLDSTKPTDLKIIKTKKHTGVFARLIQTLSFGSWMREAHEITFQASDNFCDQSELTYYYAENKSNDSFEALNWKQYRGAITYENTDITLAVKAVDLAGNESDILTESLQIDSEPPIISGVKDQSEYKQYYLPRVVKVVDIGSGVAEASYTRQTAQPVLFHDEVKIKGQGMYHMVAVDHAGNEASLTFTIVPLPDIDTQIDGSDESQTIIDQIQKELDEIRDHLTSTEIDDYEKWIDDATAKWEASRKKVIEDKETTSKVEGIGDTDFDPNVTLIVEKVAEQEALKLPRKALAVYRVYLKKGNTEVQPNGTIKVYLPYTEAAEPIVYEINEDGAYTRISVKQEGGYVTFITDQLKRYAISNVLQEEQMICQLDGVKLNIDTDGDHLPDLNLDIDNDCRADLNIDMNNDQIPDLQIDTTGDGKADLNLDPNNDGTPDLNIIRISKWVPDLNGQVQEFSFDTMSGLQAELNIDTDGDGEADLNIDVDGDGTPDLNIDLDGDGIADANIKGGGQKGSGGASTGDHTKWLIWLGMMLTTTFTMGYSIYRKRKGRRMP